MADGNYDLGTGLIDRTLGVYAGRAFDAADMTVGRVWKWEGVQEIVKAAKSLVQIGAWEPHFTTIGFFEEEAVLMVELDVSRGVDISVPTAAGVVESTRITVGTLIREFVLSDDRFGISLERVKMAAAIEAAVLEAKGRDTGIKLEDNQYGLIREVIQQPSKPYNAVVARQILPLLEYVLEAGTQQL